MVTSDKSSLLMCYFRQVFLVAGDILLVRLLLLWSILISLDDGLSKRPPKQEVFSGSEKLSSKRNLALLLSRKSSAPVQGDISRFLGVLVDSTYV